MIGEKLSHFDITAKIGQGGMGEVYRATDTKLNRDVAIKLLPEIFTDDPQRMGRFQREAQLLASLNHPAIASIHGLEEAEGKKALVMELVEGEDLSDQISRGPIPLEKALRLALQIAEALENAHDKGIIHRDLKPANIKITSDGRIKVLDFGLAKALEGDPNTDQNLTQSPTLTMAATQAGIILGTAAYMAPEQARGKAVDRRADIWAFGVVLFEMLSGKQAFEGEDLSLTLASVMTKPPEWDTLPKTTPGSILRLLKRCLDKDPSQRLQSIGEARIRIERYLSNPSEEVSEGQDAIPVRSTSVSRPVLGILILAVALAAAALAWFVKPEPPSDPIRLEANLPGMDNFLLGYGTSVVLSPDGMRLAYSTGVGTNPGGARIYLRTLDRFESDMVDEAEGGYHPFFSPDGKWVGFATVSELKKAAITGGAPLKLCEVNRSRGATWGPNGTIVFAPNPTSGLMSVSAAGGEASSVSELGEGETSHRWPQFLPDGRHVIYTSLFGNNTNEATIKVLDLETGESKVVHRGGTSARYTSSGHLLFWREGTVFAAPFDLGSMEMLTLPAPVLQQVRGNSEGGAQFDIGVDGTLVYLFGELSGPAEIPRTISWVGTDGSISSASEEKGAYVWSLRLSPDERMLAVARVTDNNLDVWIHDLERDTPSRLTFDESNDAGPLWSPDGRDVFFTSSRDGHFQIYRKSADGSGEPERIHQGEYPQTATSISADGQVMVFVERHPKTNGDIWTLSLSGDAKPEPFLITPFDESYATLSPDGHWLAYESNESGNAEVYVRPFPKSGGRWQLSSGGGFGPVWSEDGKKVYYRNANEILSVSVLSTGQALQIEKPSREVELKGSFLEGYDVSNSTDRFLLIKNPEQAGDPEQESGQLNLARITFNWTEELTRLLESAQ